jgi:ATP-dependent Zn protease
MLIARRYTDEVRKIIKSCYDEVWGVLEMRKDALWAGIKALSEQREMLGPELVSTWHHERPHVYFVCVRGEI